MIDGTFDQFVQRRVKTHESKRRKFISLRWSFHLREGISTKGMTLVRALLPSTRPRKTSMSTTHQYFQTRAARQSKQNRLKILRRQGLAFLLKRFGGVEETSLTFFFFSFSFFPVKKERVGKKEGEKKGDAFNVVRLFQRQFLKGVARLFFVSADLFATSEKKRVRDAMAEKGLDRPVL